MTPELAKIRAKQEFFQVFYFQMLNYIQYFGPIILSRPCFVLSICDKSKNFSQPDISFNNTLDLLQLADGNCVHEKTTTDRVLFLTTSALVVVGMGMTLKFYYDFAFPKKAQAPS